VLSFVEMFGGVLILGRVATAHMPTAEAQAQVYPGVSGLNALLANMLVGFSDFDLVQVGARFRHGFLQEINLEFLGQVTYVM
jgi:precorrin-6B methylase 1